MLRSLYSGISGMKNFQTKLDVIGNNIANVNTVGFKKSRVTFKDMISQTVAGGSNVTNSKQIGLGAATSSIDVVHSTGAPQATQNKTDLAIDGDGYFQINTGAGIVYTRAGNFGKDNQGNLVTTDGYYLEKIGGGKINIPTDAKDYSIGADGTVTYTDAGDEVHDAGQIGLVTFPNSAGLEKSEATFTENH